MRAGLRTLVACPALALARQAAGAIEKSPHYFQAYRVAIGSGR